MYGLTDECREAGRNGNYAKPADICSHQLVYTHRLIIRSAPDYLSQPSAKRTYMLEDPHWKSHRIPSRRIASSVPHTSQTLRGRQKRSSTAMLALVSHIAVIGGVLRSKSVIYH